MLGNALVVPGIIVTLLTSRGRHQTRTAAETKNLAARSAWGGGAQGSPSSKPVASKHASKRSRHGGVHPPPAFTPTNSVQTPHPNNMLEGVRLERGVWGLPTPHPRSKAKQRDIQQKSTLEHTSHTTESLITYGGLKGRGV